MFRLCDPETGRPWPGDPKVRIPYKKKRAEAPSAPFGSYTPPGAQRDSKIGGIEVGYIERRTGPSITSQSVDLTVPRDVSPTNYDVEVDFPFGENDPRPSASAPTHLGAPLQQSWDDLESNDKW